MSVSGRRIAIALVAELRASPGKASILLIGLALLGVLIVRLSTKAPAAEAGEAGATAGATAPSNAATTAAPTPMPLAPRPMLAHTVRRDPFAAAWIKLPAATPAPEAKDGKDQLVLQFTMLDGTGPPRAIISGTLVTPGMRIGEYEVVRIERRQAVLRHGAQEITLQME